MLVNKLTLHTPTSLTEALNILKELDNLKIQAGGTFLLNTLKLQKRKGIKTPDHILSLHKINELKGIETLNDQFIIKAMTTIDDIFESGNLVDNLSILKIVCRNISTQPIRNMATIGGNLTCRYTWTEMPAVMVALNASLHFLSTDLKEEAIPAENFFKNAAKTDKILTHISIPRNKKMLYGYSRIKKSQFVDIPLLSLCITADVSGKQISNARVGVNNCVEFAQRDNVLENFLNGKILSDDLINQALDHLDEKIYDTRSSDYKKHMFRVGIKKALQELLAKGQCK